MFDFFENLIRNSTELKNLKMKSRNCLLWIYYLEVSSYLFDPEFDSRTNIFGQYKVRIKVIRLIYDSLYTQLGLPTMVWYDSFMIRN